MIVAFMLAAGQVAPARPQDTEQWEPKPPVVTPGTTAGAAPSDAIALLVGDDLSPWVSADSDKPAGWTLKDGVLTVVQSAGNIETRRRFGSYQLHLEWRIPADITGEGQGRGNSGLFLASTGPGDAGYELQILDSYRNETYVNGQAGALYKQHPPLVNPARPPGAWQTLDVVWHRPVFGPDGKLVRPAFVTAFLNQVLIQDRAVLKGPTLYIGTPAYRPHGASPIKLQAHGDPRKPISFRSMWVREIAD